MRLAYIKIEMDERDFKYQHSNRDFYFPFSSFLDTSLQKGTVHPLVEIYLTPAMNLWHNIKINPAVEVGGMDSREMSRRYSGGRIKGRVCRWESHFPRNNSHSTSCYE